MSANSILSADPDSTVRYLLHRDVLLTPYFSPAMISLRARLDDHPNILELMDEQYSSGSWGAFHSEATKKKQRIKTTEIGVSRALALGLDSDHTVLKDAAKYIIDVLSSKLSFPDKPEKNDRWVTGQRMFLTATLARIHSNHPILAEDCQLWAQIANSAFQSGQYRAVDEKEVHQLFTGAEVAGTYLELRNKYSLTLLGSAIEKISESTERALLQWLWQHPDGIGYLNMPLAELPKKASSSQMDRWFSSFELLSRCFPGWRQFAIDSMEWLWQQQKADGTWDFGPRPHHKEHFPLSSNWRAPNRVYDWSTRALVLLRRYAG